MSPKACLGILRRASERGKDLPEKLRQALEIQAGVASANDKPTELKAFHINQRNEGIDLHGVSGALMATNNLQMQTFVTQPVGVDSKHGCSTGEIANTLSTNCGSSTERNGVFLPMAFTQNQRNEVRDLHDKSGALTACSSTKQQTFIAQSEVFTGNILAGTFTDSKVAGTQTANQGKNYRSLLLDKPMVFDNHGQDVRFDGPVQKAQTVCAAYGMGGNTQSLVVDQPSELYENHGIDGRYTGPYAVSPTLSARAGTGGNNLPLCIAGNIIDRHPQNGGNGLGCQENIAYTLTATDRHAVFGQSQFAAYNEGISTLRAQGGDNGGGSENLVVEPYQGVVGALCSGDGNGPGNQYVNQNKLVVQSPQLIRRLTPLECERLQGFPDGWTDIPTASDSPRYKALGNSVAIPCVEFILRQVVKHGFKKTEIRN